MSSIIDEEIVDEQEDLEIKSLKAKLAQIPPKYPFDNPKDPQSPASSHVASFHENTNIKASNESFKIKEASQDYASDFHDDHHDEEENEVYTASLKPQNYQTSDSNIPSRKVLDPNEERLSSNISGLLSRNKLNSNISFNYEKLTKNEQKSDSNISNNEAPLEHSLSLSRSPVKLSNHDSKNNSFQENSRNLNNSKSNKTPSLQENNKNLINSKKNSIGSNKSSTSSKQNSQKNAYKLPDTDSNVSYPMELSEYARKLSSNLDISRISKASDSNLSFSVHELSEKISSNISNDDSNRENLRNNEENKEKSKRNDEKKPSIKINKPRPQSSKAERKNEVIVQEKKNIVEPMMKKIEKKPAENDKKPPIKSDKAIQKSTKSIKKPDSLKKIKEEDEKKENEEPKLKKFLIKKMSSKENHKTLVKEIMENYEKKEKSYKEKEAEIFVREIMQKKHIDDDDDEQKNKNLSPEQENEKRKEWNKDTKIEKFDMDVYRKHTKKTVAETQSRAEKFLKDLQEKMNRPKVNNFVKEEKEQEKEQGEEEEKKEGKEEMFEEIKPEEGDQMLPDQKKIDGDFEQEKEVQLGDQLLPESKPHDNEKSDENLNKEAEQEEKNENKQAGEDDTIEDLKQDLNNGGKEEKPEENTWKYSVGEGQKTEYDKTQNAQEQQELKQATEIKKVQAEKMTSKKQKMLEIEKELRNKQKLIVGEQKTNAQVKPPKALEKAKEKPILDKPANIQNEANNLEKKEVDVQAMKSSKAELRDLIQQNKDLKVALKGILIEKNSLDLKIDTMKKDQKVVCLPNGKFTSFGLIPSLEDNSKASTKDEKSGLNSQDVSQMSIGSEERNKALETTVIGRIVNKIAQAGLTLDQVFELLDYDGDKILTINEITMNLPKLNLNLTKEENKQLLTQLDSNTDGVINKVEFVGCLENPLGVEQEYYKIMGDIKDIENPMVMEERKLDIMVRKKMVLDEIAKEEKLVKQNQNELDRMVKKMKKYEKVFSKNAGTSEKNRSEAKKNLDTLQLTVAELERKLDKLESGYKDKLKEIEENLDFLQSELISKAKKVLKAKDFFESKKNLYQKLQIKQITYEKISDKVKKDLEMISENEKKLNKHKQENMEIKAARNESSLKSLYKTLNVTYYLIRIQSLLRKQLARKKVIGMKLKLKKEKKIAVWVWIIGRMIKISKRYRKQNSNKEGIKETKGVKKGTTGEKEKDDLFQEVEIEKGDEGLAEIKKSNTVEKKEPSKSRKSKISLKEENETNPKKQLPEKKEEPKEKTVIRSKEQEELFVRSAVVIQRKMRMKWNAARKHFAKVELKRPKIDKFCLYCEKLNNGGEKKEVERICRKCKEPCFCYSCFESYHKSKQTRNHPYYDVGKNAFTLDENEDNLKLVAESLCETLKGEKFEKLQKQFLGLDENSVGLVRQDVAEQVMIYVLGVESGNPLEKMIKMICRMCLEKSGNVEKKFKEAKMSYDKLASYVNYDHLMGKLVDSSEIGVSGIMNEVSMVEINGI